MYKIHTVKVTNNIIIIIIAGSEKSGMTIKTPSFSLCWNIGHRRLNSVHKNCSSTHIWNNIQQRKINPCYIDFCSDFFCTRDHMQVPQKGNIVFWVGEKKTEKHNYKNSQTLRDTGFFGWPQQSRSERSKKKGGTGEGEGVVLVYCIYCAYCMCVQYIYWLKTWTWNMTSHANTPIYPVLSSASVHLVAWSFLINYLLLDLLLL